MPSVIRAAEATSTAGGAAAATIPGFTVGTTPATGGQLYVRGWIVTVSATPTAAAVATLSGTDALGTPSLPLHFQLGLNVVFPWVVFLPDTAVLRVVSGAAGSVLTIPTLGAAIVITAQLFAFTN